MRAHIAVSAAFVALLPVVAFAAPAMEGDTVLGPVYVDQKGMTLYTFDKDETGKSNCYDDCAVNWPPFTAAEGAMSEGDWTVIERTDGILQWAYEGKPVYLWI